MTQKLLSNTGDGAALIQPDQPDQAKTECAPKEARRDSESMGAAGDSSFPIVGIGASAGGLEALEGFFQHMPSDSGLAFVVVQHLDPDREGMLVELLQRSTPMEVIEIEASTTLKKNGVYVIPPGKDLALDGDILNVCEPSEPRGLRLPIDFFFRSLGLGRRAQSIGVILSGMGSDGSAGMRVIKEKGGLNIVQDPKEAKYDSMPLSAIDAGLADIVAPVADIPKKISAWMSGPAKVITASESLYQKDLSQVAKVIAMLHAHNGQDFSNYKHTTIFRRIMRRMGIHQIQTIEEYAQFAEANPKELDLLFKELLIGVTSFFRDSSSWDELRVHVAKSMSKTRLADQAFRAWVPACSTGEEAYSMAIVLMEAAETIELPSHFSIQIFATDLDRDAIDRARLGLFPHIIANDMSDERLERFFTKETDGYRICNEIREMVMFAPQNLIMDPPFTKMDILSCRNLLIYFDGEIQRKLIPMFHYSLNPDGLLFLGSAESVGSFTHLFRPRSEAKSRVFGRLKASDASTVMEFPSVYKVPQRWLAEEKALKPREQNLQILADQLILREYAPPTALVNLQGDILYTSGRTGKHLEPAAGKANWNLFAMARKDLRNELSSAFQKAIRSHQLIHIRRLIKGQDGNSLQLEVSLQRLQEHSPIRDMVMIAFNETTLSSHDTRLLLSKKPRKDTAAQLHEIEELLSELSDAREETRMNRERMESTQWELRATNEEMQSTNEEMQSTNEELMTSKEEMQSLNEELETVNNELQAKVEELSQTNNDMKNLLESTGIATVFLDKALNVRRYTEPATKLIRLIPGDVGRPLTDLTSELIYPEFEQDAMGILKDRKPVEKVIQTQRGKWFMLRLMPEKTVDRDASGIVITFADITHSKYLEIDLRTEKDDLKTKLEDKE